MVEGIDYQVVIDKFVVSSLNAIKSNSPVNGKWRCNRWSVRPNSVSLINQISNPAKYHKKLVLITGVSQIEFENNSLYFSKDDFVNGLTKNEWQLCIS